MTTPLILATLLSGAPVSGAACCHVVELRQYTLHPGQRDVLIDLFERSFIEPQEELGMAVVGHFRDLDRPDRFVWIRGFESMAARPAALSAFYGGPVWKAHRDAANATMIDSDNVLLLKPIEERWVFPPRKHPRAAQGVPRATKGVVVGWIHGLYRPADTQLRKYFAEEMAPLVTHAGGQIVGGFETEESENNFPKLPVRSAERVIVWFALFDSLEAAQRLERSEAWRNVVEARLSAWSPWMQTLHLEPASRSALP